MADTEPPTTMSYPLPPQYTGAPGQQPHDIIANNSQANPSHMPPPPLPPVVIPQNNNPIPTAISSPGNMDLNSSLSPSSGSGSSSVRRAAPEPNKRALYVGGLDPRVTEDVLRQIFETTGHVQNVKIIPDKTMGAVSEVSTPFITFYLFPANIVVRCKIVGWKMIMVSRLNALALCQEKGLPTAVCFRAVMLTPPQYLHPHFLLPLLLGLLRLSY